MRIFVSILLLLAACCLPEGRLEAGSLPPSVLVVQQSDTRGPFPTTIFSAFQSTLNAHSPSPPTIYAENLDLSRFISQAYKDTLVTHLKAKYIDKPISVIVAIGAAALSAAVNIRAAVWPSVPIVFVMVDQPTLKKMNLPANITGSIIRLDLADMVRVARAAVPDLASVAIVGDAFEQQTLYRHFEEQLPVATKGLEVINLMGLPMNELRDRVARLPERSAILYLAIYSDGRGTFYPPVYALSLLGEVANRPTVVAVETLLNGASIGGFVMRPVPIGEQAARLALRVLDGEKVSDMPLQFDDVVKPVFDWRQLQRWNIDVGRLPAGSDIRNRPATMWDHYRWQILSIGAICFMLGILAALLMHEHHSRLVAEVKASQRMSELAHVNRNATAGEMSAGIAHELNQPLGAILNNTETAELILNSPSPDLSELRDVLADIRRDDQRAVEIIRHLRSLVSKKAASFQHLDLNEAVREALAVAEIQARAHGIVIHSNLDLDELMVSGDPIQLQQVILNLVMNSIEATDDQRSGLRDIVVRTAIARNNQAEFMISDFGAGIAPENMAHLFDAFFTTKNHGMGMGLSLAHTIVEAHHGTIFAENGVAGGAVFRFRLPLVRVSSKAAA